MPRQPRLLLSHSYYHIMTRGNNRGLIFKQDEDYRYYLDLLLKYKAELPFDLYHYCLMPNHTHFLVRIKQAQNFSNFMKKVNVAYYHFFKRKYDWVGHLWQGRFKSRPVGKDQYFIQCGKYIELNPVKAGLVSDPGAYTFSSYRHYTEGFKDKLITDDFIYLSLGEDSQERGIKYHELVIDQVIESTYIKSVWGSGEQIRREKQKINSKFNPSRLKK